MPVCPCDTLTLLIDLAMRALLLLYLLPIWERHMECDIMVSFHQELHYVNFVLTFSIFLNQFVSNHITTHPTWGQIVFQQRKTAERAA